MILLEILFWLIVLAIFHTYVLFPAIIKYLAAKKTYNPIHYNKKDSLPHVSILLSVFNEDRVLEEKIASMLNTNYPKEKLEIIIGSDASTDNTNQILANAASIHKNLQYIDFKERTGKPNVLNNIYRKANGTIFIFTDADIIFNPDTIFHIIRNFKNPEIALVGCNLVNQITRHDGISYQEVSFIKREILLKYYEGKLWGTMIGAFGACYAIRAECFAPVPPDYTVDDFYITMRVLESNRKAILDLEAVCIENTTNSIEVEFKRRVRISSGNFQNLFTFLKLLWPPYKPLGFCFLSHKVIRWFVPILMILALVINIFLIQKGMFYKYTLSLQIILMLFPVLDVLLRKFNIHIILLRFLTHFYSMNLALFLGFIKYLTGIKTHVWQPTKRE